MAKVYDQGESLLCALAMVWGEWGKGCEGNDWSSRGAYVSRLSGGGKRWAYRIGVGKKGKRMVYTSGGGLHVLSKKVVLIMLSSPGVGKWGTGKSQGLGGRQGGGKITDEHMTCKSRKKTALERKASGLWISR